MNEIRTTAQSPGRQRAYRDVVGLRRRVARALGAIEGLLSAIPIGEWPEVGAGQLGKAWIRLLEASDALQHGWWVAPR